MLLQTLVNVISQYHKFYGIFAVPLTLFLSISLDLPTEAIEFLVTLMEHNCMTVVSPFHLANHNEDINRFCNDLHFHQERGAGQGDPPSPILWIAAFDILLEMLAAMPNNGSYYTQSSVSKLYKVNDTAYADDLVSTAATSHMQQAKADVIKKVMLL